MEIQPEKRKVTAQQAIALLEKQGVTITPENAQKVVDFMYILATMFYRQHLEK